MGSKTTLYHVLLSRFSLYCLTLFSFNIKMELFNMTVKPGMVYKKTIENGVHLSQAVLQMKNAKKEHDLVHLIMKVEGQEEFEIANFSIKTGVFQTTLNLELLPGMEVSFMVAGSDLPVTIFGGTGFMDPDEDEEDFDSLLEEGEDMSLDEDSDLELDSSVAMDSTLESPVKGKKRKAQSPQQANSKKHKLDEDETELETGALLANETLSDGSDDEDFDVDTSVLDQSSMLDDDISSGEEEEENDDDIEEEDKQLVEIVKANKNKFGKGQRQKGSVNVISKDSPKRQEAPKQSQSPKSPKNNQKTEEAAPVSQKKNKKNKRKSMAADASMVKSPAAATPKAKKEDKPAQSPMVNGSMKKKQKFDTPKAKMNGKPNGSPMVNGSAKKVK